MSSEQITKEMVADCFITAVLQLFFRAALTLDPSVSRGALQIDVLNPIVFRAEANAINLYNCVTPSKIHPNGIADAWHRIIMTKENAPMSHLFTANCVIEDVCHAIILPTQFRCRILQGRQADFSDCWE
jgi:hypothetical protein